MAKKRYSDQELTGATPKSLIGQVGQGVLSGLAATGNALDLLPSMARDVVGGVTTGNWSKYNPVDQLMDPFGGSNRQGSRDILRDHGLVGKKDTWGNFAAGMAGDILLDPLLPFTFGSKAVGAAGKLAQKAGVFDDIGRIASMKAGKLGSVGAREARTTLTLGDIAKHAPDQFGRIQDAAAASGENLANLMNEPLGGMAKNWLTGTVHGTGKMGQSIARGLDTAGDAIRHFELPGGLQPVGDTINLFSRRSGGGRDRAKLQAAGQLFDERERLIARHGTAIAKVANDLKSLGHTNDDRNKLLSWVEFPDTAPAQYAPVVKEIRSILDPLPKMARDIGYDAIHDVAAKTKAAGGGAKYAPHQMTHEFLNKGGATGPDFASNTPAGNARWDWQHGAKGGTAALKEMGPYFNDLLKGGYTDDQLAQLMQSKFGHVLPDEFLTHEQFKAMANTKKWRGKETVANAMSLGNNKVGGVSMEPQDTWKAVVKDLKGLSPELRQSGIWDNHLLTDMTRSTAATAQAIQARQFSLQHLAETALSGQFPIKPGEATTTLGNVLKELGLSVGDHDKGAYKTLLELTGNAAYSKKDFLKKSKGMGDLPISRQTADFLLNSAKGFDSPESVSKMLKIYDGWNSIMKAVLTSGRPGFHGRNVPSGQFNNMLNDQFSGQSVMDGLRVFTGGTIDGASKIPIVAQEASRRGVPLTDESATKILSELYYGADLGGHHHKVGGSFNDILGMIPGTTPGKLSDVGGTLMGKGGSWNPMDWRLQGVAGAKETTMPWLKAGEQVGNFGEHMNRFPPFLELLKQGVEPGEAAKRVREAQVGYQSRFYTKSEQEVIGRLFMFYKYFKGQLPFTMKQLIEQPSGKLSQALRGLNRLRSPDDLTPDWIADTTSIPLGEQPDGSQRYFTGLGLSFEDPLQFATPSVQNFGLETVSRLNPLLKAPLEYAFGQSTFQKGGIHGGGRPLDELDPLLGRTLANIGNITGLSDSKAPVRYPGSQLVEHLLSNSPLSAPLTVARTATDPRKSTVAKASNILTGLKIADVSPAAQDVELRRRISRIEKEMGGKSFTETYLPAEAKDDLSPEERRQFDQMQALRKLLNERSKARKKK